MQRKQTSIKLSDGNSYIFSERNMEDRDYSRYQTLVRKAKWKEVEELESDEETLFALKLQLMNRSFTDKEISEYISASPDQQKQICYDSFKIENKDISFEKFNEIIENDNVSNLLQKIYMIEFEDPASDEEIKMEFGFNKQKLEKVIKEYPHIYGLMRRSVKKKVKVKRSVGK